ncbi:unnamed protein product [Urochloa humidicola]
MAMLSSLLAVLLLLAVAAAGSSISPCQLNCGGVDIPYPFGMGDKSCFRKGFEIECSNRPVDWAAQPARQRRAAQL